MPENRKPSRNNEQGTPSPTANTFPRCHSSCAQYCKEGSANHTPTTPYSTLHPLPYCPTLNLTTVLSPLPPWSSQTEKESLMKVACLWEHKPVQTFVAVLTYAAMQQGDDQTTRAL